SHRGFAVALALLDVGPAKPPRSVLAHPSEDAADDERLSRLKLKRQPLELALRQPKHVLEEPELVVGLFLVEPQPPFLAMLQVIEVTSAGVADMRPGDNLARQHALGVIVNAVE